MSVAIRRQHQNEIAIAKEAVGPREPLTEQAIDNASRSLIKFRKWILIADKISSGADIDIHVHGIDVDALTRDYARTIRFTLFRQAVELMNYWQKQAEWRVKLNSSDLAKAGYLRNELDSWENS